MPLTTHFLFKKFISEQLSVFIDKWYVFSCTAGFFQYVSNIIFRLKQRAARWFRQRVARQSKQFVIEIQRNCCIFGSSNASATLDNTAIN